MATRRMTGDALAIPGEAENSGSQAGQGPLPNSRSLSPANVLGALGGWKSTKDNRWRHTLGIILLLVTVILWTTSNFLASTIFADNEYSKPYFVTYINTAFFVIPLAPLLVHTLRHDPAQLVALRDMIANSMYTLRRPFRYTRIRSDADEDNERDAFLKPNDERDDVAEVGGGSNSQQQPLRSGSPSSSVVIGDRLSDSRALRRTSTAITAGTVREGTEEKLSLAETAKLSFEFCLLWFSANYFVAACLEYTTVASSTILTSTSSVWTLLAGTFIGVERFTVRKLLGVLASLAGIVLISTVDMSGMDDENRGTFPHKTPREIAIGDALAFLSAVLYGFYAVLMKKRIGDEGRVNMPLFFGLVGLFNCVLLWPGLAILHWTNIERFELPPNMRILTIVLVNSTSSLISDFCWAYAMLLTSPLVVTVGLSLTIPLSLIGQMVLDSQYSSFVYWLGAAVVFLSFIFINHEEAKEEEGDSSAASAVLTVEDGGERGIGGSQ